MPLSSTSKKKTHFSFFKRTSLRVFLLIDNTRFPPFSALCCLFFFRGQSHVLENSDCIPSEGHEGNENFLRLGDSRAKIRSFSTNCDDGFNLVELDFSSAIGAKSSSAAFAHRPRRPSLHRRARSPIAVSRLRRGDSQLAQRPPHAPRARQILADRRLQVWGLVRRRRHEDARGRRHRLLFPRALARDCALGDGQGVCVCVRGGWRGCGGRELGERIGCERAKELEEKKKNPSTAEKLIPPISLFLNLSPRPLSPPLRDPKQQPPPSTTALQQHTQT